MKVLLLVLLIASALADTVYQLDEIHPVRSGWSGSLSLVQGSAEYGADIQSLHLSIQFQTDDRLRFSITEANKLRWRVPSFTIADQTTGASDANHSRFDVQWTKKPFGLRIARKSDKAVIFDTNVAGGGLTFQNQYLQISTVLGQSSNIYGLGEQISKMKLTHRTYTLWTRDQGTPENKNLYGFYPYYVQVNNGKSHGVFLHNSNGMDVVYGTTNDVDTLTYKVIGGILDFYVFYGDTPEEVTKQFTKLVGRPYLPPYWSLGFHQCRWGYNNVQDVIDVVKGYRDADIPLETMWTDIDYMDEYRDFTFDPTRFTPSKMKEVVDKLHHDGQHYMLIVDPGIQNKTGYAAFDSGNQYDLWVKNRYGEPFLGKVWPGYVHFPDWFHPKSQQWWQENIQRHHDMVPFDGMWIDMNELINFCDGDCRGYTVPKSNDTNFDPNYPPYKINNGGSNDPISKGTLDPDVVHYGDVLEYNSHNLHGYMEAWRSTVALESIRKERALVVSRSSYAGSGSRGSHWTGDNDSTWRNLYTSIPDILNFNMYGMPMVGADICGFGQDTTEELCGRWIQVGAFYPFSRNHNSIGKAPQELYRWKSVTEISKKVLNIRYNLIPLYYTLFWEAHKGLGGTVVRPLWFEFPGDSETLDIDKQMLIGKAVLLTPVLEQNTTQVQGYFPPSSRWFDYYTFAETKSGHVTLDAPIDFVPLHFRGGNVVPRQTSSYVLRDAVKLPFNYVVAPDSEGKANGSLYLDDGVSINTKKFTYAKFSAEYRGASEGTFKSSVVRIGDFGSDVVLQEIYLLGVSAAPRAVYVNGKESTFSFAQTSQSLLVHLSNISVASPLEIKWR